jgi:hypothetical protein
MSKQTALEYFFNLTLPVISEEVETARKMERDQIREAYIAGFSERDDVNKLLYFNPLAIKYNERVFNEWYNKTFGGEK